MKKFYVLLVVLFSFFSCNKTEINEDSFPDDLLGSWLCLAEKDNSYFCSVISFNAFSGGVEFQILQQYGKVKTSSGGLCDYNGSTKVVRLMPDGDYVQIDGLNVRTIEISKIEEDILSVVIAGQSYMYLRSDSGALPEYDSTDNDKEEDGGDSGDAGKEDGDSDTGNQDGDNPEDEEHEDENAGGGNSDDEVELREFKGEGTETNPYLIETFEDLMLLSKKVELGHTYRDEFFQMSNDIVINKDVLDKDGNLNGGDFDELIPIGTDVTPFCGVFDGGGYTISGLYIDEPEKDGVGLFGWFNGEVKGLTLKDSWIRGGDYVGGIVGRTLNTGHDLYDEKYQVGVFRCHNYGTVISDGNYVGGICGYSNSILINKCSNHGIVTGKHVGGLIAIAKSSTIVNSYNGGRIEGGERLGGVVCSMRNSNIYNCYNEGCIASVENAAVICNYLTYSKLSNCVNYGGELSSSLYFVDSVIREVMIYDVYYLETTISKIYGYKYTTGSNIIITNYNRMTLKQMQDPAFLETLNKNASELNEACCKWKIGKKGYPILDWVDEE